MRAQHTALTGSLHIPQAEVIDLVLDEGQGSVKAIHFLFWRRLDYLERQMPHQTGLWP
jgi:hypothetical protein